MMMKKKLLLATALLFYWCTQAPAQGLLGWPNQSEQDVIRSLHIPQGAQAPALIQYALMRNKGSIPDDSAYQALYNEYLLFRQRKEQLCRLAFDPSNPNGPLYAGYAGAVNGLLVAYEHFITERNALMIMQQGSPAASQAPQQQSPQAAQNPTYRNAPRPTPKFR